MHPSFIVATSLTDHAAFLSDWQTAPFEATVEPTHPTPAMMIAQYVDGKNLACPMPLLKLKMALRDTQIGQAVYVTATDPNSEHDIGAFCRHAGHDFVSGKADTIFHLLITKNC